MHIAVTAPQPAEGSAPPQMLRSMSQRESLYLDLIRALAALLVVFDHAQDHFDLPYLPRLGHEAVIIFFVLSGYVISFVAETRETSAKAFIIARFARLWSVLIPAILLTIACDFVGQTFGANPAAYSMPLTNWPFIRIVAAATFLSETWASIQLFSNGALWSLSIEFWYYILFAAWTFAPRGRTRVVLLMAGAAFAAPKALLLLPVWLCGVALQKWRRLLAPRQPVPTMIFVASIAVTAAVFGLDLYRTAWSIMAHALNPWVFDHMGQARSFWLDWAFGVTIAAHFAGARSIVARIPIEKFRTPIRWAAGISFATYLFHGPLLAFCAAFLPPTYGLAALAFTLGVIALIGPPIEKSKHWWSGALRSAWDFAANRKHPAQLAGSLPAALQGPADLPTKFV